MSRWRKLSLDIRTAYPGILGIQQLGLVVYNGQIVQYGQALVTAPVPGQQVPPNG